MSASASAPAPFPLASLAIPAGGRDASTTRTFRNIRGTVSRHPGLASLLLGAVAACGFAPLSLWPLALVAIAAWRALVHLAPRMAVRAGPFLVERQLDTARL